jgi:hypothetical protein
MDRSHVLLPSLATLKFTFQTCGARKAGKKAEEAVG